MSYRPDESNEQFYAEGAWLQGAIITGVLYGMVIVLSAMCWRSLWPHTRSNATGYKRHRFFLCYVTFLFLVGTIYVAFNAQITQMGFIDNRLYPGGPGAYEEATSSAPLNTAFVVSDWCADILMIWRCTAVYRDTKIHRLIIGLGSILFLGVLVCGTLWLAIVSTPAQATSGWMSFSLLFPYLCFSLAINIFISLLTVIRLLYHRHRISKVLGSGHGTIYASFATVIIESASIYSVCSLLYLIPYALNSPISYAFMQLLGEAQVIAPLLIIHRVSEGKAWTTHSATLMDNNSFQLRRLSAFPKPEPASAPPNRLNVEISFHEEITRDESINTPKSPYLNSADTADAFGRAV
ncbi:uncharacterized protein EDB91DRAFT_1248351 [Suillus paluster]|uniref:uncharacterized protein n=1 Tax=Suillus paluster TaxID=48578 RepID=UPI001B86E651|nr:uncharacterized protein EDB91DRAFT_1248351 [Suillus paluster]KAG1740467.1 hypothetical protein EDB91DRAFT_1248351 [Suillus paluster]